MSSSEIPGSPSAASTQSLRRQRWSSPMVDGLDTAKSEPFRGYLLVRSRYNLPSCSPPLRDLYIRAFDGSVALPIAEYDYGVRLGNLHRWDFHPLERQLASLQPPSGSSVDVTRGYATTFTSPGDMSSNVKALAWFPSEVHTNTGRLCSAGSGCQTVPRSHRSYAALRLPAPVGHGSGSPWRPTTRAPATCRASETHHRLSAKPGCRGEARASQVTGPSSSCVPWSNTPPDTIPSSPTKLSLGMVVAFR
jgi:hypothetical protein